MAPLASRAAFKVHSQVTFMVGSKSNVKEIHRSGRPKCFKVGFFLRKCLIFSSV